MSATVEQERLIQPESLRVVEFEVLGRPQPAGSKKAFRHPHTGRIVVTDDAKYSRPWKQQVAGVAFDVMHGQPVLSGPLGLDVTFYVSRPKGHYGTGRNSGVVKDSAPDYPTTRPDVTKLIRAVEDAMIGVVYGDDAQVVTQLGRKRFGWPERAVVRLNRLDG